MAEPPSRWELSMPTEGASAMDTELSHPFQLHLPDGRALHGVQFPGGHVALDDHDRSAPVGALALGVLIASYRGVVLWPEDIARQQLATLPDAELHARFAHPDYEYATTEGQRKQWDDADTPPAGDGWERNTDAGRNGWDRFDYTEESYWRRRKTPTAA